MKRKMKNLMVLLTLTMMPLPAPSARKAKRQTDFWGSWGEWSACSRSCSGGISFRQRCCYSQRTDGGSNCIGPTRNYNSCNIQSCPEGSRDFRAEQCAEFDGTEFQGKTYKWLPYYGAPNKCELNCIPKGENFYYRHKEAVTDGTPCEPGKQDVCVEGICQAVGCDNMLNSAKKEDKCLQCGGDGRACYEVKGTFDVPNLPKGYNQILIIPMGATSLRIKEVSPSKNFLAIKNVQGEYYLNGHWTIDFSRALHIASTVVYYDRGSEGDLAPELLHSRGPTTEPLVIELISQEPNQGIWYEYYLPLRGHSLGYSWSYGSWSDCSSECGGGYQSRLVFCTIDNEAYPDYMCRDKPKPANNQTCGLQTCPQTKSWKTGEWGACSATCGGGVQTRSVYCLSYNGQGSQEVVDDAKCMAFAEQPQRTQPCNMRQCATWSTGPWSECSASCGEGIQTRTVTCRIELGSQTQDFACPTDLKPPLSQPCVKENCIQETGWHTGDWGLCSKSCDSGIRTRQVICADGNSKFYPDEKCKASQPQLPAKLGSCNTQPCYLPQQVPSMQDTTGYDISRQSLLSRYSPDSPRTVYSDERTIRGSVTHRELQPSEDHRSNLLPLHWESHSSSSGSQQISSHQDVATGIGPQACSQSPHGCCLDGHTPASGPFGQGCPFRTCHQSSYGCCADGISAALGPNNLGCPQYVGDVYVNRNRPTAASPAASQALSQQNPSDECRGSRYGCCYDNAASASGPQGEGCLDRPSQLYPVKCLLPSAHGPCTDWTTRWYFVTVAGKCNRFWYGGCHGNTNNFASEMECMRACQGTSSVGHQHHMGTLHISSGSHSREGDGQGQTQTSARRTGSHSQGGGTQGSFHFAQSGLDSHTAWQDTRLHHREDGWRRTLNADALPESSQRTGTWASQRWGSHHAAVPGERRMDQESQLHGRGGTVVSGHSERQLTVNGQVVQHEHEQWRSSSGADTSGVDGPGHRASSDSTLQRSLHRILEGAEVSIVEAALGQTVHLLCKMDSSPFSRIEWKKDGKSVSSDRHAYQSDTSLVISHVRAEDAGTYTCIISNGKMESRRIQLRLKEGHGSPLTEGVRGRLLHGRNHQHTDLTAGVKTVQSAGFSVHQPLMYRLRMDRNEPSVVDANIGDRVRLSCHVEASPALSIEWQKDGQPLSSPRYRQQSDGALVISRVSPEDAGYFTCVTSNGRDQAQHKVQLRTLGELRITGLLPSLTVAEGENAQLRCRVTGNNVNVRWSRNGVPMRADGHHIHLSQDGSLIINNAEAADEGSYTCNAYRGSSSVSASTEVKVIKSRPEAVDGTRECVDQPHLANCDLILQAQLCSNEYYSSFCCASCSQYQPQDSPSRQQG